MRQQRDDLVRRHRRLSITMRRLERENESLRRELERFQAYPSGEEQDVEAMDARQLEHELGLAFHAMPDGIYPGKPYVTQQELIKRGITRYSRQNMSRLARGERSIPALVIGDRVLFSAEGVRTLLERERAAERDASPRRRPGGHRRAHAE